VFPHLSHSFLFFSRCRFSLSVYYPSTRCDRSGLTLCCITDMEPEENGGDKERVRREGEDITLLPFGMATYKMQGDVWLSQDHDDQERLASLYSVADSWLKQLRVQHHDFNYFCNMSMTHRG